jgi:hypothetical protein
MTAQKRYRLLPSAPRVGVEVSEDIITASTKRDSSHCMIAEAVQLAVPEAKFVSVDIQTIRFSKDGYRYTYLTPRTVQQALILFDQGNEKIPPFRFQLRTGQTTRAGSRAAQRTGVSQPRTDAQHKATEKAASISTKPSHPVQFARGSGEQDNIPEIRGGRVPPVGGLPGGPGIGSKVPASRRRQFGLRAMDKVR